MVLSRTIHIKFNPSTCHYSVTISSRLFNSFSLSQKKSLTVLTFRNFQTKDKELLAQLEVNKSQHMDKRSNFNSNLSLQFTMT
jgi:hypothetical protein